MVRIVQVIHHALAADVRAATAELLFVLVPGGTDFVTVAGWILEDRAKEQIEPGAFRPLRGAEKWLPFHIFTLSDRRVAFRAFKIHDISR